MKNYSHLKNALYDWMRDEKLKLVEELKKQLQRLSSYNPEPRLLDAVKIHISKITSLSLFDEASVSLSDDEKILKHILRDIDWKVSDLTLGMELKDLVPINMGKLEDSLNNLSWDDNDEFEEVLTALKHAFDDMWLDNARHHLSELQKLLDKQGLEPAAKPEASPDALFGQWAFAEDRPTVPFEDNTKAEDSVFNALNLHVNSGDLLRTDTINQIQDLIRAGDYTDLLELDKDEYPVVWRGMYLGHRTFTTLLGREKDDLPKKGETINVDNLTVKPRYACASWSVDHERAKKFALAEKDESVVNVVLWARVSDNPGQFIINPDAFYDINRVRGFSIERETIGVGPIKIFKVEVVRCPKEILKQKIVTKKGNKEG